MLKINLDDIAELKGQIVDSYEDFAAEHNLNLPNSDRDEAIEDGEDPDDLAIIYGDAYDTIADYVDNIFAPIPENNFERLLPVDINDLTDDTIDTLASRVAKLTYSAFEELFKPHNLKFDFTEHTAALTDAANDTLTKFIKNAVDYNKLPEEERDKKAGIVGRVYTASPEIVKDFEGDTIAVAKYK